MRNENKQNRWSVAIIETLIIINSFNICQINLNTSDTSCQAKFLFALEFDALVCLSAPFDGLHIVNVNFSVVFALLDSDSTVCWLYKRKICVILPIHARYTLSQHVSTHSHTPSESSIIQI